MTWLCRSLDISYGSAGCHFRSRVRSEGGLPYRSPSSHLLWQRAHTHNERLLVELRGDRSESSIGLFKEQKIECDPPETGRSGRWPATGEKTLSELAA